MLFAMASISMLFMGLTSAYIVRQGSEPVWRSIPMPPLLLVNTAILAASSFSMEKARRTSRIRSFNLWLQATVGLGTIFVAGQLAVWRQLSDTGIYLGTNPHSSFFYLLTGLHGLHLLGGILALSFLVLKAARSGIAGAGSPFVEATAFYWHFMGALWAYLLLLLFKWS
jgi:cytochrome c oxidase subunit 3